MVLYSLLFGELNEYKTKSGELWLEVKHDNQRTERKRTAKSMETIPKGAT